MHIYVQVTKPSSSYSNYVDKKQEIRETKGKKTFLGGCHQTPKTKGGFLSLVNIIFFLKQ